MSVGIPVQTLRAGLHPHPRPNLHAATSHLPHPLPDLLVEEKRPLNSLCHSHTLKPNFIGVTHSKVFSLTRRTQSGQFMDGMKMRSVSSNLLGR